MLKNQNFGVELEMTGITQEQAAKTISAYFWGEAEAARRVEFSGSLYRGYHVQDTEGRTWKTMSDSSIEPQRKVSGARKALPERTTEERKIAATYRTEMVTPKLSYGDIGTLQEITRRLRKAGALVNGTCGVHIHIDAANHNARTLRNLTNIFAAKEDLLYQALEVSQERLNGMCKPVEDRFLKEINKRKPSELGMGTLQSLWYNGQTQQAREHYSHTRYRSLNLHNVWYRGTVEFRLFEGTLHAGKIKAYVQLALAMSAQAIAQRGASAQKTKTDNAKYTFRTWLLRLGLIGEEFETARKHLLANLEGDSAWRGGREQAMAAGR